MEKSNNNSIKISYDSMAPKILDSSEVKPYEEAFEEAITDKNVKNIAFTGKYGAGKSSIIKTIINGLTTKDKQKECKNGHSLIKCWRRKSEHQDLNKRTLWLSLACFSNGSKKSSDNREPVWKAIEKSLVQQMLYMPANADLPLSHYYKTEPTRLFKKVCYFVLTTILVFSLLLLSNVGNSFKLIIKLLNLNEQWTKGALLISFCVVLIILLWKVFEYVGYNLKISKLIIGKTEFKINEDRSEFNFYFNEILYFFLQEQYSIVVFEDIDRFDDINVFEHLRELNNLLNNNDKIQEVYKAKNNLYPIKFVYAIRDDAFSKANEDRANIAELNTKFFEWIIPVVPYMSHSNVASFLLNRFKGSNSDFLNFLRDISIYCADIRTWESTINEFKLYQDLLRSTEDDTPEKLFSILFFKNMYPSEFNDFAKNKGYLYEILYTDACYKVMEEDDNEELKIREKDYENVKGLNEEWIVSYFKGELLDRGYVNGSTIASSDKKLSFRDITYENLQNLYIETNNGQKYILVQGTHAFSVSFNELFGKTDQLDPKEVFQNDNDGNTSGVFSDRLETYKRKIIELENNIDNIRKQKIADLIKMDSKNVIGEQLANEYGEECASYLHFSLSEGYIDESSSLYLSSIDKEQISAKDLSLIRKLRSGMPLQFTQEVENIENFIMNLDDNDLNRPGIKLAAIIKFGTECIDIESNKRIEQAYTNAINLVCDDDKSLDDSSTFDKEIKVIFDQCILNNEKGYNDKSVYKNLTEKRKLIKLLSKKLKYKWHIKNNDIEKEIYTMLFLFLESSDVEKICDNNPVFIEYINSGLIDISFCFELDREKVKSFIENKPVKISKISSYKYKSSKAELLSFLVNENKIEINTETICDVITAYGGEESPKVSYNLIKQLKNKNLKNFVDNNINDFINAKLALQSKNQMSESKESLLELLSNERLEDESKDNLINTYCYNDLEFCEIPEDCVRLVFECKKYKLSWSNLEYIENDDEFSDDEVNQFVNYSNSFENMEASSSEEEIDVVRKAVNSCKIEISSKNIGIIKLINDYDGYNQNLKTLTKMIDLNVVKLSEELIDYPSLGRDNFIKLLENKVNERLESMTDLEKRIVDKLKLEDFEEILRGDNSSEKLVNIAIDRIVNQYIDQLKDEPKSSVEDDTRILVAKKCLEQYKTNEQNYLQILQSLNGDEYELMIDLINLTRDFESLELYKIIPARILDQERHRVAQIKIFDGDKALLDKLNEMKIIGNYSIKENEWTIYKKQLIEEKLESKTDFLNINYPKS